jgi:putative transposase
VKYGATAVARALGVRRQRLYAEVESRARPRASRLRAGDRALARRIRQVMDEEPTYGYRRVTARLRRRRRINRKRVQRIMRAKGWRSLGYQGRRGTKRRRLPIATMIHAAQPNRLWGLDHTSFWAGDRVGHILIATDHCDRDAMSYRLTAEPPTAQTAIDTLEQAVEERGGEYLGELEIRTDGGPQFVAHRFTATVRRLGFKQTVTPKRSPQYNPFAEALLGALKEECVYQSDWKSYEEAVRAIEAWFHKYRHRREQNALGGLAPLEYRVKLLRRLVNLTDATTYGA